MSPPPPSPSSARSVAPPPTCSRGGKEQITAPTCSSRSSPSRDSPAVSILEKASVTRSTSSRTSLARRLEGGRAGRVAREGSSVARRRGRRSRRGPARSAEGLLHQPQRRGAREAHRPLVGRSNEISRMIQISRGGRTTRCSWATRASARRRSSRPRPQRSSGHRPGRAQEGDRLLARHGRAHRRYALPRRVRGAPQGRRQGAAEDRHAVLSSSARSTPSSAPARPAAARWTRVEPPQSPPSRGRMCCIGSTTFEEFRQHFEKDRALSRRFQRVAARAVDRGHEEDPRGPPARNTPRTSTAFALHRRRPRGGPP